MEHLLGLLYSMLRSLPANSDARVRLLAKFVEKDYEKISLILAYRSRIADSWASSKQQTQINWKQLSLEEQEARGGEEWLLDQLSERKFSLEVMLVSRPYYPPTSFNKKMKINLEKKLTNQYHYIRNIDRECRRSLAGSRRRRSEAKDQRRTSQTTGNATGLEKFS